MNLVGTVLKFARIEYLTLAEALPRCCNMFILRAGGAGAANARARVEDRKVEGEAAAVVRSYYIFLTRARRELTSLYAALCG